MKSFFTNHTQCFTGRQKETREAKAEMEGLCKERCEEGKRGGRLEKEDTRQRRVEKTIR